MKRSVIFLFTIISFLSCVKDEETETPSIFYNIEVAAGEGGNVNSSGGSYESGTSITLTATANDGYTFSAWSNGSTDNPLTLSVGSNLSLTAEFVKQKYALTVNVVGKGEVREEIVDSGKGTDYESGTTVRLTPIPEGDWSFYRWNNQIADTTQIKEIFISEPTIINAKFDFASGKKMVGQWKLGSNDPSFLKSSNVLSTYLIVDYALNFFIVESTDEIIDQDEIDAAPYGMIDPTSPTSFDLNFGVINVPEYEISADVSMEFVTISMPSENFGSESTEDFDMNIVFGDKTVEFSVQKSELDLPLADDGTIAPPTLAEDLTENPEELAVLTAAFVDDFKESTMGVLQDDTLFPEVCILEITEIELTSDNNDDAISCDEDIKVTVEFPRNVLAPVELIMTDKDGNFETIGMTPVTDTPSSSIDLSSDTFDQWEVNITRNGALNWIDVSTDNTVTLTISHKCYTGSEELTYDLLEECSETATGSGTIAYQVRALDLETYVTQDEENYGKVYCGDYLKFNATLPEAHNGSVHIKLVYANEDEELITMAPVGSMPTADWSIDNINLMEENYGDVNVYVIMDFGAENETWLVNHLVLDYQEGMGCTSCQDIPEADLTSDNDDEDIECDEDIKVTVDFGEDVLAPVELIMTDKDGNFDSIGMTPVTATPSSSIDLTTDLFNQWEVNITRSGALNWIDVSTDNTVTLTVSHTCYTGSEELTYDLLEECAGTTTITYQVLSPDMETYVTQNEENYGKVYCGDNLKFDINLDEAHDGSVHLKLVYADGEEEVVTMAPDGTMPTADWTIDNISLIEGNYGDVNTYAILDYTSADEQVLSSDLVLDYQEGAGCVEETVYNGLIPLKLIYYPLFERFYDAESNYLDEECRENLNDYIIAGEKIRYQLFIDPPVETLHVKITNDATNTEEIITAAPYNGVLDELLKLNPEPPTTATSGSWYLDYDFNEEGSYTVEIVTNLEEEQTVYNQLNRENPEYNGEIELKLSQEVISADNDREEITGYFRYLIQNPNLAGNFILTDTEDKPYGTIDSNDYLSFELNLNCPVMPWDFRAYIEYENGVEDVVLFEKRGFEDQQYFSRFVAYWTPNMEYVENDQEIVKVSITKNLHYGGEANNLLYYRNVIDKLGYSIPSASSEPGMRLEFDILVRKSNPSDCEEITLADLVSNNNDGAIQCDEDINVLVDFQQDVFAPVELVMTDKDGNFETIGMTPVTATPSSSIDLTTQSFNQWEVNITRSGALNWIDVSTDNTVTLTVSHTCYTGSEELTYDLLEECTEENTATIAYQILSTDMVTYVTQNEENYGKVYCGDNLKFDVTLASPFDGDLRLLLEYSDGIAQEFTLAPVGSIPTADWTIENMILLEGKYGNVTATALYYDDTEMEVILEDNLILDYQEGAGCPEAESFEATLEYQIKDLEGNWITQAPENYGTVNCDDILKINVVTESPQEGLHFTYQDPDGIWNDLTMVPVGDIPTTQWTLEEVSLGEKYGAIQTYVTFNKATEDEVSMNEIIITYNACQDTLPTAAISYQILELDSENYITQDADSYGTIFCDDTLKINVELSEAQSGSVHLRVTYSDGEQQHITLAPDGDMPALNWTIDNMKLSGAFGDAVMSIVIDYASENEIVIGGESNELNITFNESELGCE